ncbi:MAG: hypothetical protein U0T32_14840 [Chitinophagales bacterium]|jgi:hypothetical protein
MKKLALSVIAILSISLASNAQAFEKGGKYISLGLGGSNFWHISSNGYFGSYGNFGYTPITGQLSVQGEFGVHKYVGVGFTTGIGGRAAGTGIYRYGWGSGYSSEFNIPIGVIANFHFYQLIADKVSKDIHADKLDVYAGLNLGSGVAMFPGTDPLQVSALFFVGPQVGARYFFTPNMAANLEVGYGKTWVNGGLTFKIGK